jgi:hypothetical protein
MRKDVIHSAAMNVERLPEMLHCHRGTFQVPARTAAAKRGLPLCFRFILGPLPEDEIIGLLLFVLIRIDASANLQFTPVQTRQPAIGGKTRDAVVNGVTFTIGMPLLQ